MAGRTNLTAAAGDWATTRHEYAVEWDGHNRIAFVVDGKTNLNVTRANQTRSTRYPPTHPQFSGAPFHINLNTALGGPAARPVSNNTVLPAFHYIDYVLVSQQ